MLAAFPIHAASDLFDPAGRTTIDEEVSITNEGMSGDPTGISSTGNSDASLTFNGLVSIQISDWADGTNPRSGYGVSVSDSYGGNGAEVVFNAGLSIAVKDTENIGIGIEVSGYYDPTNGSASGSGGSRVVINGDSNISVSGTSVLGVSAGAQFNNNRGPSGTVIFGEGTHKINVVSDWSEGVNGSFSEDWAVGVLADYYGVVELHGDLSVDLTVRKMAITNGSYEWYDPAAGVFVDHGSSFTQASGSRLDINVTSEPGDLTANAAPVAGIVSGLYDASGEIEERSRLQLSGTTNIDVHLSDKAREVAGAGMLVVGGASAVVDGALAVRMHAPDGIDFSKSSPWTFYGLASGTSVPGLTITSTSEGGTINVTGALTIAPPENYNPALTSFIALYANGYRRSSSGSVGGITVDNTSSHAPVSILGMLKTANNGAISLNLSGTNANWTGAARSSNYIRRDGRIDVTLSDGASWVVLDRIERESDYWLNEGNSTVYDVTLRNGGRLDLRTPTDLANYTPRTEYQSVEIYHSLSGEDGVLAFDMDLVNESVDACLTDQITTNTASGTHSVVVNFVNGLEGVSADKWYSENWLIHQDAGDMTLTGPGGTASIAGNGMVTVWDVKFVPDGQAAQLGDEAFRDSLTNSSSGTGDWYLVRHDEAVPTEPGGIIDVGSTVAQAISWMSEKNDLRRRLGEVRYGSQAGAWAKAFNRKDRASGFSTGGFEQRSSGVHVGYDTLVAGSESSSWLLGATFRYAQSDQDGLETANGGTGDMDEYSGKLYATWMQDSGAYADLIAQVGYYKQDLFGYTNDRTGRWKTDYDTWGYGASIEIGHMLTLKNGSDDRRWFNHWFLEPQLELSYFHIDGADFRLSTGMSVEQDDADFLTGRAGFVLGKKFNYGTEDDLDRRYFQIGLIAGVTHEFLGEQDLTFRGSDATLRVHGEGLGGTSVYYGFTADWQAADRWRFYAELDREEGENYTKEYGINVGFKYLID